jgi:hypothetical protein
VRTILFSALTGNDSAGPTNEVGQTLTVTNVSNPVGGTVQITGGHVEFTPTADFNGTASFDYTVQDNGTTNGASDPKTAVGHASFTVTEVNDAPVAVADTLTAIAEDSGVRTIQFSELTGNDSPGPANESAQALTVSAVNNATAVGGTVAIVNGRVEFTPTANFNGTASFDYTVQDDGTTNGAPDPKTAVGHATFTVTAVNDAPVLDLDSTTVIGANGDDTTAAYTVSGPAAPITSSHVSITDVDDTNVASATVTLINAQTNDVLAISGALPGGISATVDTSVGIITVKLSGSATHAQYQTALHQIMFSNGSAIPDRRHQTAPSPLWWTTGMALTTRAIRQPRRSTSPRTPLRLRIPRPPRPPKPAVSTTARRVPTAPATSSPMRSPTATPRIRPAPWWSRPLPTGSH